MEKGKEELRNKNVVFRVNKLEIKSQELDLVRDRLNAMAVEQAKSSNFQLKFLIFYFFLLHP